MLSAGTLRLRGLGSPNSSFSAQATSDFLNWTNRSTNTVAPDGRFDTQFSADTNGVRQFYRTKAP